MCDPECRKRFETMNVDIFVMTNDIVWIKRICVACVVIGMAGLGLDISGEV